MIVVSKLTKTCPASPAQWSGVTDKGEEVYVRYRWGYLRVEVNEETVFAKQIGWLRNLFKKKPARPALVMPVVFPRAVALELLGEVEQGYLSLKQCALHQDHQGTSGLCSEYIAQVQETRRYVNDQEEVDAHMILSHLQRYLSMTSVMFGTRIQY